MMRARRQTEQEEQAVHQRSLEVDLEQASIILARYQCETFERTLRFERGVVNEQTIELQQNADVVSARIAEESDEILRRA